MIVDIIKVIIIEKSIRYHYKRIIQKIITRNCSQ